MRQALFVIVVVGAAFGGGALVNGPGFRWAQDYLLTYMGLQDGGEIASIDLPPAPGESLDSDAPAPTPSPAAPTLTQTPPAADASVQKPEPPRQELSQGIPAPAPEPKVTEPFTEPGADAAKPTAPPALLGALVGALKQTAPAPGASNGPTMSPGSDPVTAPAPAPAPLDPSVAPAAFASPPPPKSGSGPTDGPLLESAPAASTTATVSAGDWAEVRQKLSAQGVTRYTIEGEPGGRVVFSCLIPLAGKQAVSQRFEAEGSDEFQAAHAALRRINLWRAAQAAP